jgi:hypothetical protein
MMQTSTQSAPASLAAKADRNPQTRTREERTYQAVTVVAILLVLCSLWVF